MKPTKNFTGIDYYTIAAMASIFLGEGQYITQDFVNFLNEQTVSWVPPSWTSLNSIISLNLTTKD
jgi:hypothetical protein